MLACVALGRDRDAVKQGLILRQLQDFDKGVCVCEARRPSGGVSRQIAHTPVLMTLEG